MPKRRNPRVTPGAAHLTSVDPADDFTLPAALFHDSVAFFVLAQRVPQDGRRYAYERQQRYTRAAVMAAVASFEAQVNQAAFAHAEAHEARLEQISVDVLTEQETTITEGGQIQRRRRFWPTESRFSFLTLFLSGQPFDRSSHVWRELKLALEIRDRCAHPKPPFSSPTVEEAEFVIRSTSAALRQLAEQTGTEPVAWHKASFESLVRSVEEEEAETDTPSRSRGPRG